MVTPLSTHASLLARLSSGSDAGAWAEFAARYQDLIRGFARRRGLQPADVEDVVQEVFLALGTALKGFSYDPQRGRFRGYLKTIAGRTIGARMRGRAPLLGQTAAEQVIDATADVESEDDAWEAEWRQYHLRTAMERVRAEFRASDLRAFDLVTRERRPAADVAEELDISVDSVYQAKSRILGRLRDLVAEQVEDEG